MGLHLGRTVKSLLQLISANVAVRLLSIFMLAFYTRYLTKEELAVFPIYEMLSTMASIIFSFGLHPTLIRQLPSKLEADPDEARGMMYTAGTVLLAGSIVYTAGVILLAPRLSLLLFKDPAFTSLLRILSIGFLLASIRTTFRYFLWASSRFDRMSVLDLVSPLGRIVLGASLLLLYGMRGLAIGLVINELLTVLLSYRFTRDLLHGPRVTWYPVTRIVRESFPFYMESFLIYFRSQGDNWIIATMLGPSAMSVYFVAKRLPGLLLMLMESLDKVLTSELSRRRSDTAVIGRYIHRLYQVNGHLVAPAILFATGLTPAFILAVAGSEYSGAVIPAMILCFAELIRIMAIPLGRALFVTHPPITRVWLTVVETVFLVATLVLLAPTLGTTGVALSRLAAAAAALVLIYIVMRRFMVLDLPWRAVGFSLAAAISMAGTMLALQFWHDSLWEVPLFAGVGLLVFFGIIAATNGPSFYATLSSVIPFPVPILSRILDRTGSDDDQAP